MISSVPVASTMKLLCILSVLILASVEPAISSLRSYDSIFSFGDSFADTGNGNVVLGKNSLPHPAEHFPYGQTFFGYPTGRSSNGRLIIDFIAQALRLPLVAPFLYHNGSFSQGANFAVIGATALDVTFFKDIPIASMIVLNTSSAVQLQSFESLKASLCSPAKACPQGFFDRSLFFVGEFGFNDYSFALLGRTLAQVKAIVPDVVRAIAEATEELIKQGAQTVVVPGIPPLGCSPANLSLFPSADPAGYEPTGCLKGFNELAVQHNSLLQETLENIRTNHPSALVVYADFYTPIINMVKHPSDYGFSKENVLKCCCGGGGKYNFNMMAGCGMPGATVCEDPSTYVFWDGHFTEAANRYIAKEWIYELTRNHLIEATNRYSGISKDSA